MNDRKNILGSIITNPQSTQPLSLRLVVSGPVRRGQPLNARLVASGGAGGYVYAITGGALPAGTGPVDAVTGVIAGTPTTIARYQFTASVEDSSSTVETATFAIDVQSRLTALDATPTVGEIGIAYDYQLRIGGATGAVTWAKISGTLPAGVTLSTAGVLSGTPTTPHGTSYAAVRATDAGSGDTLDISIAVTIAEALQPVATLPEVEILASVPAVIEITQFWEGGVAPFQVEEVTNVSGYHLLYRHQRPDARWVLMGTPPIELRQPDVAAMPIQFRVTDALGATALIPFALSIRNPVASLGTKNNGVALGQRSDININFTGSAVTSVTNNDGETTVTIDKGTGTVTGVTASAPLASSGGAAPNITHANSGATAGTYTNATVAVNATGHVTSASSGPAPVTSVAGTSPIVSSGGATPAISHANSGVSAGTYSLATVTVNAQGHVTSASGGSVAWGSISGFITAQSDLQTALNARGSLTTTNTWSNTQTFSVAPTAPSYNVSGTKVVGARDTGWGAMTGSTNKASITSTAFSVLMFSNPPTQAECIALRNACVALAQRIGAYDAALIAHGLIGP